MATSSSYGLNAATRDRSTSAGYWESYYQNPSARQAVQGTSARQAVQGNRHDRCRSLHPSDNTRLSYRAAIEHFESHWGGFLPATADSVARYLVGYANTLSVNTLRQRLAGLAAWHLDQGFPDPTKAPHVKKVLKGIAELHPVVQKQAKPIQLDQLSL